MSTSPAPQVSRGDITLQPSYFTSSLFVDPLREDVARLIRLFSERYLNSTHTEPFALFKKTWTEQGWTWLHFKVFDGRARETFIRVTLRVFAEHLADTETPLARVVALFGMYTFFFTQPSTSSPAVHSVKHIALPIDVYGHLLDVPAALTEPHLLPLQPYATYVLSTMLDAQVFHILPDSSLRAQNPASLPREHFIQDGLEAGSVPSSQQPSSSSTPAPGPAKKRGRPTKRDKIRKAKDAVVSLDKWLDKNTCSYPTAAPAQSTSAPNTTHTLISHPPVASRANYSARKAELLDSLYQSSPGGSQSPEGRGSPGVEALQRANSAVLARLKKIDEMAAEKGLEVGGEGGEMTGLARVERAVNEFGEGKSRGGILNLLEGAGAGD